MNMLYLQRDKVLKEQAKRIQVLETKREEVRTVKMSHGESGYVHDANGCLVSLGVTDPGFLGVPNVRSVNVTECVPRMSEPECARMECDGE